MMHSHQPVCFLWVYKNIKDRIVFIIIKMIKNDSKNIYNVTKDLFK